MSRAQETDISNKSKDKKVLKQNTAKVSKTSTWQNITHAGYVHLKLKVMINLYNVTFAINVFKKEPLAWYWADCTTEIPFSVLSNKDLKDFLY